MTTEILSKKKIYEGLIFDVSHYEITLPNGKSGQRDIIEHNGACLIIPVTNDGQLVMVRQYRTGANAVLLEFPAGKLDKGEEPEKCALRELAEETGYVASKIRRLMQVHPVPPWCTELVNVFLAEDLTLAETNLDEEEFVEVELHSLTDLLDMVDKGELVDMKTVMGVLLYERIRNI